MARAVDASAQEAMNAEGSEDGAIILLTITHPDLPGPIRLSSVATSWTTVVFSTVSDLPAFLVTDGGESVADGGEYVVDTP